MIFVRTLLMFVFVFLLGGISGSYAGKIKNCSNCANSNFNDVKNETHSIKQVIKSDLPDCPVPIFDKYGTSIKINCFGTFTFPQGNKYTGEWNNGKPDGRGTFTYRNRTKYLGEWKDGKMHGKGTLTFAWGDKYIGEFKDGDAHGKGTLTSSNGEKYIGECKNNQRNGQGTEISSKGIVKEGIWKDNKFLYYKKAKQNNDTKPIIASNQTKDPNQRPLASLTDSTVCYNATTTSGGKKVWNDRNDNFVGEAKYRGLDCGVNKSKKLITNNQNIWCQRKGYGFGKVAPEPPSDGKNCFGDRNKLITEREAANEFKGAFNKYFCESISKNNTPYISDYLDIKNKYSIKCNKGTFIASKPKNTKPSISSAELEKERAKRLEEERKRKALEQRIAELEKKNKELQQPKKQQKAKPKSGSGSGFFISKLGHIITNQHVVNKCKKITIGDHIDKQVPAQLLETDRENDLALLRTTNIKMASAETQSLIRKLSIEIIPLASGGLMRKSDVKGGEDVIVAGFPYGVMFSKTIKVTKGIVSSTRGVGDDSGQFQIDAAVQPGNSGGPIYDRYGNIVGVVVAQLNKFKMAKSIGSLPENVNFGIKASTVSQFLNTSGVITNWAKRTKPVSNEKLFDIASKQTVMVVCHR